MFFHHVKNDIGAKIRHGNEFLSQLKGNSLKRVKRRVYHLKNHTLILYLFFLLIFYRVKQASSGPHRPSPKYKVVEIEGFQVGQYTV